MFHPSILMLQNLSSHKIMFVDAVGEDMEHVTKNII